MARRLAIAAGVLYALTLSRWHSHDLLKYAADAASGDPVRMLEPAHLGYDFLAAALPLEPLRAMLLLNVLSAALSVGLFAGMLVPWTGPRRAAWAAAGLAFSFSFWNYAVEGEVYAPANAAALGVAASLAALLRGGKVSAARVALLWTLAVLLHQYNILLAPLVLWALVRARGWRTALAVSASAGLLCMGAYALAAGASGARGPAGWLTWALGYGSNPESWGGASAKWALPFAGFTLARACFGWITGLKAKEILLGEAFHGRLGGSDLDRLWNPARLFSTPEGLLFCALLALTAAGVLWLGIRLLKGPDGLPRGFLLAWALPFAVFFSLYDPGNVEFSPALLLPLWAAAASCARSVPAAAWAVPLLLAGMNLKTSILPRRLEPNEERRWACWLAQRESPRDTVLVLDATEMAYANYFTPGRVLNARLLWKRTDAEIDEALAGAVRGGTLYVEGRLTGERDLPDLWWEAPGRIERFRDALARRGTLREVYRSGWRSLHVLEPHAAP